METYKSMLKIGKTKRIIWNVLVTDLYINQHTNETLRLESDTRSFTKRCQTNNLLKSFKSVEVLVVNDKDFRPSKFYSTVTNGLHLHSFTRVTYCSE